MSTIDLIDNAIEDWATSNDAMRCTTTPPPRPTIAAPRFPTVAIQVDISAFTAAMTSLQAGIRTIGAAMAEVTAQLAKARQRPVRGRPTPLRIDGHAYRRRQRARRHA